MFWCPLSVPTVLLGFLLPWTWVISSWLLQQSAAAGPYIGPGVFPHGCCSWPWTWGFSSQLLQWCAATACCSSATQLLGYIQIMFPSCPWGRSELDTTEWLHFHFSLSCIGEGNGNPLQCSCPGKEEPGGLPAIYGVAQSWTWLKRLSSSSSVSFRWSLQTWVIALQISLGFMLNWHLTCTLSKPALKCIFSKLISSPVLIILSKGCSSGYFFVLIQKRGLICFNL